MAEPVDKPLRSRLAAHCPAERWERAIKIEADSNAWTITDRLSWGGNVVRLVAHGRCLHVVLLSPDGQRWHPLLLDFVAGPGAAAKLEVVSAGGQDVLYYSSGPYGSGSFENRAYFTLDQAGRPRRIPVGRVLLAALKKVLPEGAWTRLTGFDIRQLRFAHEVWSGEDVQCCPTGGRVRVDFELDGSELRPQRYAYDAAFDNERVRRGHDLSKADWDDLKPWPASDGPDAGGG
jgi:hypothetical protein